jgi:drug/metabolite transporter (DMT)-like permease
MDWFPLTLLCAFSLATADALTKKYLSDYSGRELVLVRFALPALLLAPLMLFEPLPPVPPIFWAWIAALVPLELAAMLLYMLAIRDSPLHLTIPYLAFTPVFNILTGWLVLGEEVSLRGAGGIALVVVGAYLLNLRNARRGGLRAWLAPFPAVFRERGSRLMLGTAAIYSLTSVMGKAAMGYATPASFGPFYFVLLGIVTVAALGVRRPGGVRVLWRRPAAHLAVGLAMAVMVVTHFLAIARVEVAYMIAVKRTSLLFGILYGALLFREQRLGQNMFAGGLMVTGVALILL